jgi:hypothetical protein
MSVIYNFVWNWQNRAALQISAVNIDSFLIQISILSNQLFYICHILHFLYSRYFTSCIYSLNCLPNCMEQSLSGDGNSCSASQEMLTFYGTWIFIIVLAGPYQALVESSPHPHILLPGLLLCTLSSHFVPSDQFPSGLTIKILYEFLFYVHLWYDQYNNIQWRIYIPLGLVILEKFLELMHISWGTCKSLFITSIKAGVSICRIFQNECTKIKAQYFIYNLRYEFNVKWYVILLLVSLRQLMCVESKPKKCLWKVRLSSWIIQKMPKEIN